MEHTLAIISMPHAGRGKSHPTVEVLTAIQAQASSSRMDRKASFRSWQSFENMAAASKIKYMHFTVTRLFYTILETSQPGFARFGCSTFLTLAGPCSAHFRTLYRKVHSWILEPRAMHSFTFSLSFCANLGTVRQEARLTVPSGRKLSKAWQVALPSNVKMQFLANPKLGSFSNLTGHVAWKDWILELLTSRPLTKLYL